MTTEAALCGLTATEAAISPVELVDAVLAHAERLKPALALPMAKSVRLAATQAEADVMPGGERGPLHGVPVKDNVAVAGLPLRQGLAAAPSPAADAVVVQRIRAAGAALIAPLAVGTEGGGSVRSPASCTGVVGLKATLGRIPNKGAPDSFGNFFFVGPMARTVADTALLLSVDAFHAG